MPRQELRRQDFYSPVGGSAKQIFQYYGPISQVLSEPGIEYFVARSGIQWGVRDEPSQIVWHTELQGKKLRYDELSSAEASRIDRMIEQNIRIIESLAEELSASPDPKRSHLGHILSKIGGPASPEDVFIVNGLPVITGWGIDSDDNSPPLHPLNIWRQTIEGQGPAAETLGGSGRHTGTPSTGDLYFEAQDAPEADQAESVRRRSSAATSDRGPSVGQAFQPAAMTDWKVCPTRVILIILGVVLTALVIWLLLQEYSFQAIIRPVGDFFPGPGHNQPPATQTTPVHVSDGQLGEQTELTTPPSGAGSSSGRSGRLEGPSGMVPTVPTLSQVPSPAAPQGLSDPTVAPGPSAVQQPPQDSRILNPALVPSSAEHPPDARDLAARQALNPGPLSQAPRRDPAAVEPAVRPASSSTSTAPQQGLSNPASGPPVGRNDRQESLPRTTPRGLSHEIAVEPRKIRLSIKPADDNAVWRIVIDDSAPEDVRTNPGLYLRFSGPAPEKTGRGSSVEVEFSPEFFSREVRARIIATDSRGNQTVYQLPRAEDHGQ